MIYHYTSRVRYSEIGEDGNMTLFSLFNNFQDCCTFHGEEAGVGLDWNMEHRQGWVIANVQCVLKRMPRFGEYLEIATWASGFRGMIARRNFRMENTSGELLAEAATEWIFMDLDSRKPIRIPQEQADAYGIHPEEVLHNDCGGRKVRMPEDGIRERSFQIQEHHLDTNGHVNNAQYIRMALPYLPAGMAVRRLRVEYKTQALLGDTVVPWHAEAEDGTVCRVRLADEAGEPYFLGEFSNV